MAEIIISIITPVYNSERHIDKIKKMVLFCQDRDDVEYIVVDDGSFSLDISEYFSSVVSKNIKFRRTDNFGAASARQTGSRLAYGRYVYFLDSDDLPNIHELSIFLDNFGGTTTDFIIFSDQPSRSFRIGFLYARLALITGHLKLKIAPSNFIVKRNLIHKQDFCHLKWGEDLNWIYSLLELSNDIVSHHVSIYRYFSTDTRGYSYSFQDILNVVNSFWLRGRFVWSLVVLSRFTVSLIYKKYISRKFI